MNDRDVLSFDPFAGDFGDPGDRLFSDKMATARKPGACHCCGGTIVAGERVRRRTELFEGHLCTFRWCSKCCVAMALSWTDGGKAICEREGLRRQREAAP